MVTLDNAYESPQDSPEIFKQRSSGVVRDTVEVSDLLQIEGHVQGQGGRSNLRGAGLRASNVSILIGLSSRGPLKLILLLVDETIDLGLFFF